MVGGSDWQALPVRHCGYYGHFQIFEVPVEDGFHTESLSGGSH